MLRYFLLTTVLVFFESCIFLLASDDYTANIIGVTTYSYCNETIPSNTRGVYEIYSTCGKIKYIGSAVDVNKRLGCHLKNNLLKLEDIVKIYIFHESCRQVEMFDLERLLIKKLSPYANRHPGAPGRPLREEQLSKLNTFYQHNQRLMTPDGRREVMMLLGKKSTISLDRAKMRKSLLKVMKLFK